MADLADVEAALVAAIIGAFADGGEALTVLNRALRVYRGTAAVSGLQADMVNGIANISVYPVPGATHNTTRWGTQTNVVRVDAGMRVENDGARVMFSGSALPGTVAGLLVDDVSYVHRVAVAETAGLVAAILADAVRVQRPCWLTDTALVVPGVRRLIGRVGSDVCIVEEWQRQSQDIRISVVAPDPVIRDGICSVLIPALAQCAFLVLADGTAGRLRFRVSASADDGAGAAVFRRDLIYQVEYGTTSSGRVPTVLFGDLTIDDATYIV